LKAFKTISFSESIEPKNALAILLVVGTIFRGFIALEQPAVLWPDSQAYYEFALRIAKNLDFSTYPIYRTPLYPTFLALFFQFGDGPAVGRAIIFAQQCIGLLTVLFFYLSALRVSSRTVAFFSALLFCIYPLQLYYEVVIQSEVLFSFLFYVSVYYALASFEERSRRAAILVGVLLGIAALARPTAQFLPFCLVPAYFVLTRSFVRSVTLGLIVLASSTLILSPWFCWNKVHKGYWGLSKELGLSLYHRVIDVDKLHPPIEEVQPEIRNIYLKTKDRGRVSYFTVWHSLLRSGQTEREADSLMTEISLAALRTHPRDYFWTSLRTVRGFFFAAANSVSICENPGHTVLCSDRPSRPALAFPKNLDTGYSMVHRFIAVYFRSPAKLVDVFSVGAIFWMTLLFFTGTSKRPEYLFFLILVLYFASLTSLLNREEDRFRLPIDPLLIFFCIDGLARLASYFRKRFLSDIFS